MIPQWTEAASRSAKPDLRACTTYNPASLAATFGLPMILRDAGAADRKVIIMRPRAGLLLVVLSTWLVARSSAAELKLLTNHLGYETRGPKHAVILGKAGDSVSACGLKDETTDQVLLAITPKATGPVQKWKDWHFWTLDFDSFTAEGKYYLECKGSGSSIRSFPFLVQSDLLERNTVSDVIYYFKGQRSSGEMDKADSRLRLEGGKGGVIDAHGGWWDATITANTSLTCPSRRTSIPSRFRWWSIPCSRAMSKRIGAACKGLPDTKRICWMKPCSGRTIWSA